MEKKVFNVTAPNGLHQRAASDLVKEASAFESKVKIDYKEKNVNLKSPLGVMALAVPNGGKITITADGNDEKEAMLAITELMNEMDLAK